MPNKDPKVLCVPIANSHSSRSARSSLNNAKRIATSFISSKRRQLSKARGQLARVGAPPKEVLAGLNFRQRNLIHEPLEPPFKHLDFGVIDSGFKSTDLSDKINLSFIEKVTGGSTVAKAVLFIEKERVNNADKLKVTYMVKGVTSALLDKFSNNLKSQSLAQRPEQSREGVWLLYHVHGRLFNQNYMCVRVGSQRAEYGNIKKEGSLDIRKVTITSPISVRFSNVHEAIVPSESNNHRYFDLAGTYKVGINEALLNKVVVQQNTIYQTPVTFESVPERPYGPEFNAIRPPGVLKNSKYAMKASVPARAIVRYYQKQLKESHGTLKDNLQGDASTLFNHNFPNASDLMLPQRLFNSRTVDLWSHVAAISNPVYDVDALSYDTRVDASGQPGGAVQDEGPFGAERGLLRDGRTFVDSGVRPSGKAYDHRIGSLVIKHTDEFLQNRSNEVGLSGTVFAEANRWAEIGNTSKSLQKLEAVCQLRLVAAYSGMYRVYVDYITVAAMYRYELGKKLFEDYSPDFATMWDVATSEYVDLHTPSNGYTKTWTALSLRVIMGSRYSNLQDLPTHLVINQEPAVPENTHRVIPFRPPADTTKLVAYGDLYPAVNFNVKNYGDAGVTEFTLGENCSLRREKINQVILHWGGTRHGYKYTDGGAISAMLSVRGNHAVSTSFTVNHAGDEVRQHIDLALASWHAEKHNHRGVGIDLPNVGFIHKSYKKATEDGYVALGYTVIQAPIVQGKLLIAPEGQYELAYQLIDNLRSIPHVDDRGWDSPKVLMDRDKYIVSSGHYFDNQRGGVCGHLHVSSPDAQKVDGVDSCLYWLLRNYFDDTAEEAYRRMRLTLEKEVQQTQDGVRYLVIDRS